MDKLIRFGLFEIDPAAGELRKESRRIKLQDQPFQLLLVLVQRPGEIVSREEIQSAVWPADTFVDFDHGVNTAIKKIRLALGDSAENPRFIETIPRKGYRFIAPVTTVAPAETTETIETIETAEPVEHPLPPAASLPPARPRNWRLPAALAVTLALAIPASWYLFLRPAPAPAPESLLPTPFTTYPGIETHAAFSPDGRRAAFSWNGPEKDNYDIYVKEIGVEVPVRLTSHPSSDHSPVFSPDGKQVAFLRGEPYQHAGIYVIPSNGGPEVRVGSATPGPSYPIPGSSLTWTPDGRSLLVHSRDTFSRVLLTGGDPQPFSPPLDRPEDFKHRTCCASFSPDGKALAYVALDTGFAEVFVHSISPTLEFIGKPRRLTNLRSLAAGTAWSPDGASVFFHAIANGSAYLWRVASDGSQPPVRLATLGEGASNPAVSSTGQLLYSRSLPNPDIWSIAADGKSPPRRLIASGRADDAAHFSPDGKRIVFISSRSGSAEVWIANADGSQPTRLTDMKAPTTGWPTWSPDGTRILFDSSASGKYHLYAISPAGGEAVQLTTGDWTDGVGSWSADGKSIYFLSDRSEGVDQLWKMPAAGGAPTKITRNGIRLPVASRDGKYIYFARGGNLFAKLWRIPVEGGDEELLLPSIQSFKFVPTADGVYYIVAQTAPLPNQIRFHSWATGLDRVVATLPFTATAAGLDLSPDGKTLIFAPYEQTEGDLMSVLLKP